MTEAGQTLTFHAAPWRILRPLRVIAMLASIMLLAGCWESKTLLFSEAAFIDPWGGEHQVTLTAMGGGSADRPVRLEPAGKWFQFTDDKGETGRLAFAPGGFAEQASGHQYLTVVSHEPGKTYRYAIGTLSPDGRELGVCGLPNTQEVSNRAVLDTLMRDAFLADRQGGQSKLTCGKLSAITPVDDGPAPPQPLSLAEKQKALRDMEQTARTAHSAGRSNLAQRFVQLVGPDIECAGSYLGKAAFPQQGPDGELWYLIVVYFGNHADEIAHSSDFPACGEAVLNARQSIAFTKLSMPYRIIAFDRNFRVFLDSGVTK